MGLAFLYIQFFFSYKVFYLANKKDIVWKGIRPGNSKSLWTAVNLAKDVGTPVQVSLHTVSDHDSLLLVMDIQHSIALFV